MTKEKGIKFDLVFFKKNIALILFLVLLVFNIVATNNFLSWITFNNFFKQVSRVCLVSLGMSLGYRYRWYRYFRRLCPWRWVPCWRRWELYTSLRP